MRWGFVGSGHCVGRILGHGYLTISLHATCGGAWDTAINSIVKTSLSRLSVISGNAKSSWTTRTCSWRRQTTRRRDIDDMEEWSLSYMWRHSSRHSGSKLSQHSCHKSWCRGDWSGNSKTKTTVKFVCWWLSVHFRTNCYWNFRSVWR